VEREVMVMVIMEEKGIGKIRMGKADICDRMCGLDRRARDYRFAGVEATGIYVDGVE
jgi:hypothetical protein